jgi:hypothetical protein
MYKKLVVPMSSLLILFLISSYTYAASIDLAWDAPSTGGSVVGYIIYGSTTSNDYSNPVVSKIVEEQSITISGLDKTQTYYFIVKAYNCAGSGDASNEIEVPANSDTFYDDSTDTDSDSSNNTSSIKSGGGGGGCFVATAAYGSAFESHVKILREFRDSYLMKTRLGRAFIELYYRWSPGVANIIKQHNSLRTMVRWGLAPVVATAYISLHTSVFEKIVLVIVMISLIFVCGYMVRKVIAQV